ncbi:MAG: alginate export family protein [Acidobacteriales bacterium]|nr:alginate export family protein [Terriglobales bacterium]
MKCPWIALVFCLGSSIASAQTSVPEQPKPAETIIHPKIGSIEFSGSLRTRLEDWNFFDAGVPRDGEYSFSHHLLRFAVSQKKDQFDWQIETAVAFLAGMPNNAIAPAPVGQMGFGATYFAANNGDQSVAGIFVKQAFLRFWSDSRRTSARFGRFEFIEGQENEQKNATLAFLKRERIGSRLIGNFGFSAVGRSFDGVEAKYDDGRQNITVMGGRATRGVFQVDGIGELDVDAVYAGYTRQARIHDNPGEWRLFGMYYHDGRTGSLTTKTDNRPLAVRAADHDNIRIGTIGANYLQTVKSGGMTADIVLWGALQYGAWGILDQRAYAVDAEFGAQATEIPWKPWVRAGYSYFSGDNDPADYTNRTFFLPLGTPRIYARFPFYNPMNTQDAFGQLILRPHKKLSLRFEGHGLRLADHKDLWYSGGGAFQKKSFGIAGRPSGGSSSLASVVDAGVDWNVHPQLAISGYYAHAIGGAVIQNNFPDRKDADYAYLELLYRF